MMATLVLFCEQSCNILISISSWSNHRTHRATENKITKYCWCYLIVSLEHRSVQIESLDLTPIFFTNNGMDFPTWSIKPLAVETATAPDGTAASFIIWLTRKPVCETHVSARSSPKVTSILLQISQTGPVTQWCRFKQTIRKNLSVAIHASNHLKHLLLPSQQFYVPRTFPKRSPKTIKNVPM